MLGTNASPDGLTVCLEKPLFPTGQRATTAVSNKPGHSTEEDVDLGALAKRKDGWEGTARGRVE